MPAYSLLDSPVVLSRLLAPAIEAHEVSHRRYRCTEFKDLEFIEMGVARVVSESMTGRDFLQGHADNGRKEVELTLFFKALQSERRLANLASVNLALAPVMKASCLDPFAAVPELKKFAIYSGDGHYHGAACHDVKLVGSSGEPKKYPTGHFFMLDFRTHHARHMATAEQGGARKGEHDMRAIKRTDTDVLRCGEPKGRKVIVAWDPAGIDLAFWQRSKRRSGREAVWENGARGLIKRRDGSGVVVGATQRT